MAKLHKVAAISQPRKAHLELRSAYSSELTMADQDAYRRAPSMTSQVYLDHTRTRGISLCRLPRLVSVHSVATYRHKCQYRSLRLTVGPSCAVPELALFKVMFDGAQIQDDAAAV